MPERKGSGKIIIGGTPLQTDFNVVNFTEGDGWDASQTRCIPSVRGGAQRCTDMPFAPAKGIVRPNRSRARRLDPKDRTLKVAQSYIRQLVVHLDGCIDADACWDVLQNERGLSCHFILDDNGTLYQTLDLIDCAYHASGLNETSIGIEICNRGDAKYEGDYARARLEPRAVVTCHVHGEKYVALDFAKRQYETMDELAKFLAKALPGIARAQPRGADGDPLWTTLVDETSPGYVEKLRGYSGFLGHYHITKQKWDPGPFDFTTYLGKMRGRNSFPLALHGKAQIPERAEELSAATQAFYKNNEEGGGFFPVGPEEFEGEPNRLWHGGVHLHVPEGEAVLAPWAGEVVAARNVPDHPSAGAVGFVLLRHVVPARGVNLEFFTLVFHLRQERDKERPRWMGADAWLDRDPGSARPVVFKPGVPVQAGERIGGVGRAGPDAQPELHFEIFLTGSEALRKKLDREGFWILVGGGDSRFCDERDVLDKIDKAKPKGTIDASELRDLFLYDSPERDYMRRLVTYHPSEWSDSPSWKGELWLHAGGKPRQLEQQVDEYVAPTLFWENVARELHLPESSNVYTVHPITFVAWLNKLQLEEDAARPKAVMLATASDRQDAAAGRTGKAKMDLDDVKGESFVNAEELLDVPPDHKVEAEQLREGFGD